MMWRGAAWAPRPFVSGSSAMSAFNLPIVTLPSGEAVPQLGQGTWHMGEGGRARMLHRHQGLAGEFDARPNHRGLRAKSEAAQDRPDRPLSPALAWGGA